MQQKPYKGGSDRQCTFCMEESCFGCEIARRDLELYPGAEDEFEQEEKDNAEH